MEDIGRGVEQLKYIAKAMNHEVNLQANILENMDDKMEFVGERTGTVNERMRDVLRRSRDSDKVCVVSVRKSFLHHFVL